MRKPQLCPFAAVAIQLVVKRRDTNDRQLRQVINFGWPCIFLAQNFEGKDKNNSFCTKGKIALKCSCESGKLNKRKEKESLKFLAHITFLILVFFWFTIFIWALLTYSLQRLCYQVKFKFYPVSKPSSSMLSVRERLWTQREKSCRFFKMYNNNIIEFSFCMILIIIQRYVFVTQTLILIIPNIMPNLMQLLTKRKVKAWNSICIRAIKVFILTLLYSRSWKHEPIFRYLYAVANKIFHPYLNLPKVENTPIVKS